MGLAMAVEGFCRKGQKRRGEGRWGIGNKPQHTGVRTMGPLTHLPSFDLFEPTVARAEGFSCRRALDTGI